MRNIDWQGDSQLLQFYYGKEKNFRKNKDSWITRQHNARQSVSYTHLDVYKRQRIHTLYVHDPQTPYVIIKMRSTAKFTKGIVEFHRHIIDTIYEHKKTDTL